MPLILGLAVLFDLIFGEPGNRWHPVAWVGRGLELLQARVPARSPAGLLAAGAIMVVGAALVIAALAEALVRATAPLGWPGVFLHAWLLKCTFSVRGLIGAAGAVKMALALGSLDEARRRVGWHLVSRPTATLSADQVASATVESVAENFTDSVVAPLLFFLLFGLPGAWAYRMVNTADAMWGYREGELEYFGKPAARLDDLLSWIPARLAGAGIVVGALIAGERAAAAWRTMWRDHARTASPNAGWAMAAMAGALGVALEKPGAYRLGDGPLPTAEAIHRAVSVMTSASGLFTAASLCAVLLRG